MVTKYTALQEEIRTIAGDREVTIVAVSKYASIEETQLLYKAGLRHFGESKVQALEKKQEALPYPDITWHFIGHVQSNKLRRLITSNALIQSVDRRPLLQALVEEAEKTQTERSILLQVKITDEPTKQGFSPLDILQLPQTLFWGKIKIQGLMVMGPNTDHPGDIQKVFHQAKVLYEQLKTMYTSIDTLSMGMSHDYPIALKEGATQLRLGQYFL